jgi:prolyl-tRNA editing enzyme YbaK/EbsC (Cys-tRNA(Pro) deacylase)
MLSKKLLKYLEDSQAKFDVLEHKMVYTAYDAAQTMKVKLNEIGKNLLVKFNRPFRDGTKPYAIVIVGADKNIDLKKLKKVVSDCAMGLNKQLRLESAKGGKKPSLDVYNKVAKVEIPKEKDMKDKFKTKPGAMTAFGTMYRLPVFIDKDFLKNKKAIFAGDDFRQSIKMLTMDFHKLENAFVGSFSTPRPKKKSKTGAKKTKPKK